MTRLGVREARRGRYYTGDALEWHRLDYASRRNAIETTVLAALTSRGGSQQIGDKHIEVQIARKRVLVVVNGIPDALTVPAALELIGRPFLLDYQCSPLLAGSRIGPVHILACNQGATEAQARRLLGFPDATYVRAPFGVYVTDRIQKTQMVFLSQCRDETTTRHGVQRFFDWLEQSGEDRNLAATALSRKHIVRVIAEEAAED
jgi:hypothetical protein